jgi:hypothetical protein
MKSSTDNIEKLESSLVILGRCMIVSTGFVVVGLFIELLAPLMKLWGDHDLKDFVGSSIGTLLVAGGVAAELLFDFFAHRQENKLRLENDEKDRQLNERLKLADERIAEAEKRTAEARLETEKLKEQFAWRRLPYDQRTKLIAELSTRTGAIWIERLDGDVESQYFANQFVSLFLEAKWHVGWKACRDSDFLVVGDGMLIPTSNMFGSVAEEWFIFLLEAFKRAGMQIFEGPELKWGGATYSTPLPPEPAHRLFIGAKQPNVH